MNEDSALRQVSPAALRMRRSRERRKNGQRMVSIPVLDAEVDALITHGLLDPEKRTDRRAIAGALAALLDRIPIAWWQTALRRPART